MKLIPKGTREKQIAELCEGTIYSFVGWVGKFKGNRTPVKMNCELHGNWEMYLPDLFRNVRCAACKNVRNLTESEVLERIDSVCRNKPFKFVRWEKGYSNTKSRAVFKCAEHGEWVTQYVSVTASNSGCPVCSKNGFDVSKRAILYCFGATDKSAMKVGITNNLRRRIVELKRTTPFDFELITTLENEGHTILALERVFHSHFESLNTKGFNGCTEWLKWNPKIPLWFEYLNG